MPTHKKSASLTLSSNIDIAAMHPPRSVNSASLNNGTVDPRSQPPQTKNSSMRPHGSVKSASVGSNNGNGIAAPRSQPQQRNKSAMSPQHKSVKSASVSLNNSTVLPPSALRKGKFDVSTSKAQPLAQPWADPLDLSIIQDTFGDIATLYHVLRVEVWAEAVDIRRAYLRQGRETLLNVDGGFALTASSPPRNLDDVPVLARKKFQAISIAYEILSTPELRSDYDKYGVVYAQPPTPPPNATEARRQNSVRWKPYVEEKVIVSHPDEHSRTSESAGAPTLRKKQEREFGWLESRVRHIDEEAEKFLRGDTLEHFVDESFTTVKQSIGSLIRKKGNRHSTQEADDMTTLGSTDDSEFSASIESKPKKTVVKQRRAQTNLFHQDSQHTVQPQQRQDNVVEKDGSSVMHSPCSVMQFIGDMTGGAVGVCGLNDLIGRDDELTVYSGNLS